MERPLTRRPLSIQDENSAIHHKKIDGKSKSSRPITKKGGAAPESRKALNDITNKSSIHLEVTSQKKNLQIKKLSIIEDGHMDHHASEAEVSSKNKGLLNERVNVADERCLHDHSKCVEAQKTVEELHFWEIVLPGHDSADPTMNEAKSNPDVPCYPEPEELSMSEFSDWSEIYGKSKSSRPLSKKGGAAPESRKALNDITNKSSIHLEVPSQKKNLQNKKLSIVEDVNLDHHTSEADVSLKKEGLLNEKVNIADERFLHDHSKCIEAQKAGEELNFWEIVLPGHDSADPTVNEPKSYPDIRCYPEPEELSMSEFSDWLGSWWKSPPSSPMRWDSPSDSPFSWDLEPVELMLKEEEEDSHV